MRKGNDLLRAAFSVAVLRLARGKVGPNAETVPTKRVSDKANLRTESEENEMSEGHFFLGNGYRRF